MNIGWMIERTYRGCGLRWGFIWTIIHRGTVGGVVMDSLNEQNTSSRGMHHVQSKRVVIITLDTVLDLNVFVPH